MPAPSKAERLEAALIEGAPAAWAMLNRRGRAAAFPEGIPFQSAQAAGCRYNATMGQVTDGAGRPLSLPSMSRHLVGLSERDVFLYARQGGQPELRRAWRGWQDREARGASEALPLPMVTAGLTNGLALASAMFVDRDTEVLIPDPCWGNYHGIFGVFGDGWLRPYRFFDEAGRFDVASLRGALADARGRKAVLVVNFPGNPTGYTPRLDEVPAILDAITGHPDPLVVICDDAYHGMVYREGLLVESLFWELTRRADPSRLVPVKVDGATKELFFFGGRVGFLTFGVPGEAGEALDDKARALCRFTVSSMPGPSQALVLAALEDHAALDREIAEVRAELKRRFDALEQALGTLEGTPLSPYPANSGCFQLLRVAPPLDAEALRLRLLEDHSVGAISVASLNALRIAFCSMSLEDIPEAVARIRAAVCEP